MPDYSCGLALALLELFDVRLCLITLIIIVYGNIAWGDE